MPPLRRGPGRRAGDGVAAASADGTRYVHLACTTYLTHMHTGDRSAEAIDAGQVLPSYCGVIVRDGYAGYGHLTDALHAWCGAHLLRDLKGLYGFEPQKQKRLGIKVPETSGARPRVRAVEVRRGMAAVSAFLGRPRPGGTQSSGLSA